MSIRVLPQHLAITGALALALCVVAFVGAAGSERAYAQTQDYRTGEVIVKLRNPSIDEINDDYGTITLDEYFRKDDVYLLGKPDNGQTEEEFSELLMQDPQDRVLYAQPNFVSRAPEDPAGDARMKAREINGVNQISKQYAVGSLGLSCASAISRGKGVTVAVLDTGAQLNHQRLENNINGTKRYDFVDDDAKPAEVRAGLDSDGDGVPDELYGHGTHVAGIVDFVAPSAKIMPLRVLDPEGYGNVYTISKAISFAQINGAGVINLSLGGTRKSDLLRDVIGNAIDKGVVVTAAAGNSNSLFAHYPAAKDGLLASADGLVAVTSVDEEAKKSDWANYGTWVDLAAPGENIRSTYPGNKYATWSGTSMATPFVSGQAALIRQVHAPLDPMQVEARIRANTDTLADPRLGQGHANICKSLE